VGVKILDRVHKSSKSRPGGGEIIRFEGGDDERLLLFEIRIGLSKGVAVKVIFIVTQESKQPILIEIGGDDGLKRTVAESPCKRAARDLEVDMLEHPSIISEATPRKAAAV
jgi:hypothetical protein